MGRLRTIGFEIGSGETELEGVGFTRSTAIVRSGDNSAIFTAAANKNDHITLKVSERPGLGVTLFARVYLYMDTNTDADQHILKFVDTNGLDVAGITYVQNDRTLVLHTGQLLNNQVGSASAPLDLGRWYRLELSCLVNTGSTDAVELKLDGVTTASGSGLAITEAPLFAVDLGYTTVSSVGLFYLDDFALNSSAGSSQNSFPGEGKIVLLKPTSDNSVGTGWVDGDGSGTLFGSVDNTPPAGKDVPADGTQIKNLTSTSTGNYDANMTAYNVAGIGPTDTITLVQAICDHGEDVSTASKSGALQIVSNPAQASEDTFTYGDDQAADGDWPGFWAPKWGTPQYSPSITFDTAPVLRVGKRTATTREVHVDFMGIWVEYVEGISIAQLNSTKNAIRASQVYRE